MTRTRLLEMTDAEALLELRTANWEFLAPWEPTPPPDGFTVAGHQAAARHLLDEFSRGTGVPLVILDEDRVIGRITLSNIVRGPLMSTVVGYWVAEADNGRGHASRALAQACELAYGELGLHRVEAGTLPENGASQRVLERNGFIRYGLAPDYLQIAGRWRDHVLFQRLAPDAST